MNDGLLVPALMPFTFHWYTGDDPPFCGVAVKVTDEPAQYGLFDATMVTPTGTQGFTVMVTGLVGNGPPQVPDEFWIWR